MKKAEATLPTFSAMDYVRDAAVGLFYYKRSVAFAFAIPVAFGVLFALKAHTSYVAQAKLLVLYSNDYVFHPGARDTGNDIALDRNEIMQGELEILNSQSLIEHTLEKVGVRVVYPSFRGKDRKELPLAAQRLLRDFSIAAVPQARAC